MSLKLIMDIVCICYFIGVPTFCAIGCMTLVEG